MKIHASPAFGMQKGVALKARWMNLLKAPANTSAYVEFPARQSKVVVVVQEPHNLKMTQKEFSLQRGLKSAQRWLQKLSQRSGWHA